MSVRALVVAASGVAAVMMAACGPDSVTLPTPPMAAETAALVAAYEMPTAVVDPTNVQQLAPDIRAQLDEIHTDWLPGVVVDALARLRTRLDASELSTDPSVVPNRRRAQITAVVEVTRICAGWDSPAGGPDVLTNGAINVTGIVDTGRINPEVWGNASACRVRFPSADSAVVTNLPVTSPTVVRATLDGTLTVYLQGPVPKTVAEANLIVSFNGTIALDGGATQTVAFDFQIVNGTIRFRVPIAGGFVVVTLGTTVGVQAANGGFTCDLALGVCQST